MVLTDAHEPRRLKVLQRVSPSQIQQWETCPRKWWFGYIAGEREPQSRAQAAGQDIDDNYAQFYLKTGTVRTDGEWAPLLQKLIPFLPAPGPRPDLSVQATMRAETYPSGPELVGYADWVEKLPDGVVHVGDLKTTSDFKYAKTTDQLRTNTQMVAYAEAVYQAGAKVVTVEHVYGRRKRHAAIKVPAMSAGVFVSREHVAAEWAKRVELVRQMVKAAQSAASHEDLTPNTESCDLFGGCFYRAKCGLAPRKGRWMSTESTGETLMQRLQRLKAGASTQEANPVDIISSPPPPPPEIDGNQLEAARAAVIAGNLSTAGGGKVFSREGADTGYILREPSDIERLALSEIIPPDAPSRESTPEEIEAAVAAPKRGRGKKVAPLALATEVVHYRESEEVVLAPASESAPVIEVTYTPTLPKPVLYVDCMPTKGGVAVTHLEEWLDPIATAVAQASGVEDYRMVPYTSKGVLAVGIRAAMASCPAALVIDSRQSGADVALECLIPHASLVIRGIR